MFFFLVFLWLLFVGGIVGEVDDEDEIEFVLVSLWMYRIVSYVVFGNF